MQFEVKRGKFEQGFEIVFVGQLGGSFKLPQGFGSTNFLFSDCRPSVEGLKVEARQLRLETRASSPNFDYQPQHV